MSGNGNDLMTFESPVQFFNPPTQGQASQERSLSFESPMVIRGQKEGHQFWRPSSESASASCLSL